jgi:hypothetical protein
MKYALGLALSLLVFGAVGRANAKIKTTYIIPSKALPILYVVELYGFMDVSLPQPRTCASAPSLNLHTPTKSFLLDN